MRSRTQYDRAGRSTGLAWVTYDTEDHARKAKDAFDGAPAKGQPLAIAYDLSYRPAPPAGSLLARLGADSAGPDLHRRDWDAPRSSVRDAPRRDAPSAPRGGGPGASRGAARGGRPGAPAGRAERAPRVKQAPKTAADLDAELEAFMSQPAPGVSPAKGGVGKGGRGDGWRCAFENDARALLRVRQRDADSRLFRFS